MHTSLLLFALGLLGSVATESRSWHIDYDLSRKTGRDEQKPLAVFMNCGHVALFSSGRVIMKAPTLKSLSRAITALAGPSLNDRRYCAPKSSSW